MTTIADVDGWVWIWRCLAAGAVYLLLVVIFIELVCGAARGDPR